MKILLRVFKDTEYFTEVEDWVHFCYFFSETYSNLICIIISMLNEFLIDTEQKFP